MTMNKTDIESWDYSWNPATGCDNERCFYCYAEPITVRYPLNYPSGFKPHFYPDRLYDPLHVKKPARIFTVSMGDLFCDGMNPGWIRAVFRTMALAEQHKFFILTKNPDRIKDVLWFTYGASLPNVWLGVTVEAQEYVWRIDTLRDNAPGWNKFVSFEPLIGPITYLTSKGLHEYGWALIGAMTGRLAKQYPADPRWVEMLTNMIRNNDVPLFIKDSLEDAVKQNINLVYHRDYER